MLRNALGLIVLLLGQAQPLAAQPCASGNLLERSVVHSPAAILHAGRLTDGVAVAEGVPWDTVQSAVVTGAAPISFDLGVPVRVRALLLQGDHFGAYRLSGSLDGRGWFDVWEAPAANAYGMRVRYTAQVDSVVRWLRIEPPRAGSAYALSEVQAHCAVPALWPPRLEIRSGPVDRSLRMPPARSKKQIDMHRLTVAVLGWMVLFAMAVRRGAAGAPAIWAATALSVGVSAYVLYESRLPASALERWLQAGAVAGVALPALALVLRGYALHGLRGTPKGGTCADRAAALAGLGALVYAVAVALLYRAQSTTTALLVLATTFALAGGGAWQLARRGRTDLRHACVAWTCLAAATAYAAVHFGTVAQARIVTGTGPTAEQNTALPGTLVRLHDQGHYYLGAKYFAELGYERLYHCIVIAEQDNGRGSALAGRQLRDLRTNELVDAADVLGEPEVCRAAFSAARWAEFRADVDYLRTRATAEANEYFLRDHGFNASPFWIALSHPVVAGTRASDVTLWRLAWIDISLLLAMLALLFWAFGVETAMLAAVLWGTGTIWVYGSSSNLGYFGRLYWVFAAVAAVCLLRKGYLLLGGGALALAVLDRVFPGALLFGPALVAAADAAKRQFDSAAVRVVAGATLVLVALSGASLLATGGQHAAAAFLRNSLKHSSTPLMNYIGLPTLASITGETLKPHVRVADWKRARARTLTERRALYFSVAGLLLAFSAWVCWSAREPWRIVVAGLLPMFCVFDLTNYYYVVLILLAPLAAARPGRLTALLGALLAGHVIYQHTWDELMFPLYSLVVLVLLLYFMGILLADAGRAGARPAAASSARW